MGRFACIKIILTTLASHGVKKYPLRQPLVSGTIPLPRTPHEYLHIGLLNWVLLSPVVLVGRPVGSLWRNQPDHHMHMHMHIRKVYYYYSPREASSLVSRFYRASVPRLPNSIPQCLFSSKRNGRSFVQGLSPLGLSPHFTLEAAVVWVFFFFCDYALMHGVSLPPINRAGSTSSQLQGLPMVSTYPERGKGAQYSKASVAHWSNMPLSLSLIF